MSNIKVDANTVKEFVSSKWKSHKDYCFYEGGQIIDNIDYFIFIDKYNKDYKASILLLKGENEIIGYKTNLTELDCKDLKNFLNKLYLNETTAKIPFSEVMKTFSLGSKSNNIASKSIDLFFESIGEQKIYSRLPKEDLIKSEHKRILVSGLQNILDKLNNEALEILSVAEDVQLRDYKFYSDKSEKGVFRRQAGKLYPLLSVLFSRRPSLKMAIDGQKPLVDAIIPCFGEIDGKPKVNKATINKIRNISWNASNIKIDYLLKQLAEIPADWFPKNEEDWNAFCWLTETAGALLTSGKIQLSLTDLYSGSQGKWREFLERSCKSFLDSRPPEGVNDEILENLKKHIDLKSIKAKPKDKVDYFIYDIIENMPYDPPGVYKKDIAEWLISLNNPKFDKTFIQAACIAVEDVAEAFAKKILMPLASLEAKLNDAYSSNALYDHAVNSAAKILFAGKNLQNIFENSRMIHNRLHVIMIAGTEEDVGEFENAKEILLNKQKKQKEGEDKILKDLGLEPIVDTVKSWAPLTNYVQSPNGVFIVPLRTEADLSNEGKNLSHCVAGYSYSCINLGHHIISMRIMENGKIKRLSTAELGPVIKGKPLMTRQHRGKSNGNPPQVAMDAYLWYLEQLTNDGIKINFEGIKNFINAHLGLDDIELMCGYNWRFKNLIEKAMEPWSKSLGKKYSTMNFEEFAKDPLVKDVINVISPELKSKNGTVLN